jgi:hypothetical protein
MKIVNLLFAVLFFAATAQAGETAAANDPVAGKVGYMSGTLVAQRADGTVQVLGSKSNVLAGDMLITSKDSYAQIQMNDGAKVTLRPNSNLRIESFKFNKEEPSADNAVFRLMKGGFRTVTGLIGKRGNADAYQLHAAASTIGIRGTDFSSRLCATQDCQDDESDKSRQAAKPAAPQPQVVGRVMLVQGELSAKDLSGKVRPLTLGGPVYEGDQLITGSKSNAVVAFRDEGRITLQENSLFHVEKFKYDKAAAQETAVLRLLKGGVRVVTGLIGRVNHDNYQFHMATSTIGIRGTGFDAWCNGPCASGSANPGATDAHPQDGAGVFVWSGEVQLATPQGAFNVGMQQMGIVSRDSGTPIPVRQVPANVMNNNVPRPDSVPVDMDKAFGSQSSAGEPGLYVTVHDGHVILAQGEKSIDLGRSETGFSGTTVLTRLASTPSFMGGEKSVNSLGGNSSSKNPSVNPSGCAVQ